MQTVTTREGFATQIAIGKNASAAPRLADLRNSAPSAGVKSRGWARWPTTKSGAPVEARRFPAETFLS